MNLWNRFKYRLLVWLLGDVCCKSDCDKCLLTTRVVIGDYEGPGCGEEDILYQAREAWRIE